MESLKINHLTGFGGKRFAWIEHRQPLHCGSYFNINPIARSDGLANSILF